MRSMSRLLPQADWFGSSLHIVEMLAVDMYVQDNDIYEIIVDSCAFF